MKSHSTVSPLRQCFPFAGLLLAAMTGILLASWIGPSWWTALAAIILLAVLSPCYLRGALIWMLTAGVFFQMQLWNWNDAPARRLAEWLDLHPVEYVVQGVVIGEPKISLSGSATFPMRLERLRRAVDEGMIPVSPVSVQVRWSGPAPVYGDRVAFQATPQRPPPPRNPGAMDYRRWLERNGVFTQFRIDPSAPGNILSHGNGSRVYAWAIAARHRMEAILATDLQGAPEVLSAIKGITLGVTDEAPEGFTDEFRFTGTMHLFSVSGLHVGMLAVIIWFLLKAVRIPRIWAVILTIPSLFFYVAVTGLKSGSIRSATMASVLLIGMVLFRRSPMINTLAASAFLQLAWDTNVLFSAGWQFSYAVVLAIIVAAPPIEHWLRALHAPDSFLPPKLLTRRERAGFATWNHLAGLAAVSASAWIGSLIPTIAYFHLVSLSAFGANMLAVPLAFGVLSLGALSLICGPFSLWIAGAFNNANWLVTKVLLLVVQLSALVPGGHWFVGPPGKHFPVMTILDLRGASCAVIRSGGETALIDTGRLRDASGTILPFLEVSGVNSLLSVLITKADAAHLGGLDQIEREIRVDCLGLPPGNGRSSVARKLKPLSRKILRLQGGEEETLASGVTAGIMATAPVKDPDSLLTRVRLGTLRVLILPRLVLGVPDQIANLPEQELRADILLLPLGGSEMVSTLKVIRRISPRVVISGVDAMNRNGIPSGEWHGILKEEGITLLRQDETGAVTLEADPKDPKVVPFLQSDHPIPLAVPPRK